MSTTPDLFLGLVTHQNSAFNSSGESTGALEGLAQQLRSAGLLVETLISDRDDYTSDNFPISADSLRSAAKAQSQLERDWRLFLISRAQFAAPTRFVKSFATRALYQLMVSKRLAGTKGGGAAQAAKAYRRLLNIDLSHRRILEEGIKSGASLIVVLEDDASPLTSQKVQALADVIRLARTQGVDFVNLSESISVYDLGITRILDRGIDISNDQGSRVIALDTPVTNTVCANIYGSDFAVLLARYLSEDRLTPVIPIDWRLNQVMLDHPNTQCWWVRPGLFLQRSMHPSGRD
ncbi:hypothetical protein [Haliscomenobacter sp.]|uniref:hypothetical protein n=1 Tax=Haliscomenobacter sp. TaxID=2717303 RepID=UPI003364E6F3